MTLVISNCVLYNGSAVYMVVDFMFQLAKQQLLQLKIQSLWIIKQFHGGGISADLQGNGDVTLVISNCVLFNGSSMIRGGGLDFMFQLAKQQLLQLKIQSLWISRSARQW